MMPKILIQTVNCVNKRIIIFDNEIETKIVVEN